MTSVSPPKLVVGSHHSPDVTSAPLRKSRQIDLAVRVSISTLIVLRSLLLLAANADACSNLMRRTTGGT